jgi:hypothetical protein
VVKPLIGHRAPAGRRAGDARAGGGDARIMPKSRCRSFGMAVRLEIIRSRDHIEIDAERPFKVLGPALDLLLLRQV